MSRLAALLAALLHRRPAVPQHTDAASFDPQAGLDRLRHAIQQQREDGQ